VDPDSEESNPEVENAETLLSEMDSQIAATQQWTERRLKRLAETETAGMSSTIDIGSALESEPPEFISSGTDLAAIHARFANAKLYTSKALDLEHPEKAAGVPELDVAALMDGTTVCCRAHPRFAIVTNDYSCVLQKMSAELLRRQMMAELGLSDAGEDVTTSFADG
jgi:hypothetical protein